MNIGRYFPEKGDARDVSQHVASAHYGDESAESEYHVCVRIASLIGHRCCIAADLVATLRDHGEHMQTSRLIRLALACNFLDLQQITI